ncbi:uncharacterized protein TrAFT101_002114 [Trichoderma asperellum]|uniref:uncharacterized protein n=1 Tax=Trichoderma asperellum TaxID=101201 RepID=UPI0033338FF3|nr:hypothetical protein TrAFT101_002114 [Trichoderma asperellum]
MAEMQQLSDSLHSALKIVDEPQTGSPSSCPTDSPHHSDHDDAEHKAQWMEFCNFMDKQAKERPYPEYLYRAHVHGHPFPRLLDVFMGEYADSFGSDFHLWAEYDAQSQIVFPIHDPMESWTVDDVFSELNLHLGKTSVNLQPKCDGEEPFLSSLVSLSSDFRWTAQRICRVGRMTSKDQIPGLAICKTSMIDPSVVRIWRVADMLLFRDTILLNSSVHISPRLRRWATNAQEFVCWLFVPQEALITFTPLPNLIEASNGGERAFLTKQFVGSNYLGDFMRCPNVHLSLREYADRASEFVRNIITDVYSFEEAKQWVMYMKVVLSNPYEWGYEVPGFIGDVEEAITLSIEKALETAFMER